MASFTLSRSLLLLFLIAIARFSISEAKSSFSFTSLGKNASFESEEIALYGDAKLVDGGSSISVQLNDDSVSHGGGRVVYKKPLEYTETKSEIDAGFHTAFSFSISPNRGGKLGFVVFPVNGTFDHSFFEVKFDISENFTKSKDSNVTVIVDGTTDSEKMRNLTVANVEKEKEKLVLYAYINYLGGGKFIEVRLSKSESYNYLDPMVLYRIDLSEMLKDEDEFMVGLNSDSGNISLRSWSLKVRRVSKSVHSYAPLFLENLRKEEEAKRRRRERMWETVTCFVMTFGSTGLVFFAMMHIWAAFKRNSLVMVTPEECGLKRKEFEYEKMEKMEVVISKAEAQQAKK
uniref:Legume lectin domain-containing protein n=1 Tax=Noccaea caerulescens TaxID=107243 RepID=A0A1J3HIT1_NOCCA